jgi:hypothetical protein
MYKAVLFSEDGDYVSYFLDSASIEEVWNSLDNMGSTWIFYPIHTVVDQNTNKIVSSSASYMYLTTCTVKEASDILAEEFEGNKHITPEETKVLAVPAFYGSRSEVEELHMTTQTDKSLSDKFKQFDLFSLIEFEDELNNFDDDSEKDSVLKTSFFTFIKFKL